MRTAAATVPSSIRSSVPSGTHGPHRSPKAGRGRDLKDRARQVDIDKFADWQRHSPEPIPSLVRLVRLLSR